MVFSDGIDGSWVTASGGQVEDVGVRMALREMSEWVREADESLLCFGVSESEFQKQKLEKRDGRGLLDCYV